MTLALIIGGVVAYAAIGCGAGGYTYELQMRAWVREQYEGDPVHDGIGVGLLWPLVVLAYVLWRCAQAPVSLGRRLATPKPQLPPARVVRKEEM